MGDFDDLVDANASFADSFAWSGLRGVAGAGVGIVTCMDSRIDPLAMIGLVPGDATVVRNHGGRVTDHAQVALVLGVALLGVERILVVQHTRCAMASASEQALRERMSQATDGDVSWLSLEVIADQRADVIKDVARVRTHPLIGDDVSVGGFLYDVDTGLLETVC